MTIFVSGLVVFIGLHLWAAFARGARQGVVNRLGEGAYKSIFSLIAIVGLGLIVVGWQQTDTHLIYTPPAWGRHAAYSLMAIALILIAASQIPAGHIKVLTRHPMLVGIKIWALAHLLANGEMRSLILFLSFLAFAVIDRIAVKKRGALGPSSGKASYDIAAIGVGLVLYAAILMFLHRYIAGVPLIV